MLNANGKKYLKSIGYPEEDFNQIKSAISKTVYKLDGKRISRKKVLEIISREDFLNCIGRSAFHWSTGINTDVGHITFDSSKLFK